MNTHEGWGFMKSRIRQIRESRGITQAFISRQLKVKQQTVSKWENDKGLPNVEQAYKLAELLFVDVKELYEED